MKTLKSIMLGLSMVLVFGAAKATDVPATAITKNQAINTYIDAVTRGKLQGINEVIDKNAKFSVLHGKQLSSFDKNTMMADLKNNKNVEMECTTSTSVVESNTDYTLVKVDMKFDGSLRSNYVTMVNTGEGWKITNVYSVVK